ncbi:MAG: hypothetical protein JO329_21755 [Planctomycetaceae bacterium]|nr:hypothetical protein [Planctomycetaceae bacterium]
MNVILDLRPGFKRRIWAHLLQNDLEQMAFAFAGVDGADPMVFTPKEVYFAPPDDFALQTSHGLELGDEARARIIKHAWDTETALVEFHSHPTDRQPAMFSGSDLAGFAEFVPHCRWRLRGRPYLALVVNPVGVDALVWTAHPRSPIALNAIRLVSGRRIVPSHRTIAAIRAEGPEHGPGAL